MAFSFSDPFGNKAREKREAASRAKALALEQYRRAVDLAMVDSVVTDQEAASLSAERERLGILDGEGERAYAEAARALIDRRVLAALVDNLISPEEDLEIFDTAAGLNISPNFAPDVARALQRGRSLYGFIHAPLRAVAPSLGLGAGEVCYYSSNTTAYETRTRTVSTSYGGPVVSIPIMKGVRYRIGNIAATRHTEDYAHSFGLGATVITNSRLIYAGAKSITVRLTNILDIEAYTDGAMITKTTGKPLTFVAPNDADGFAIILTRAWNQARGLG